MQPLMKTADVMLALGFSSRTTLYKAIARGDVPPPRKIGSKNRWTSADIEAAIGKLPQGLADTSHATEARWGRP